MEFICCIVSEQILFCNFITFFCSSHISDQVDFKAFLHVCHTLQYPRAHAEDQPTSRSNSDPGQTYIQVKLTFGWSSSHPGGLAHIQV